MSAGKPNTSIPAVTDQNSVLPVLRAMKIKIEQIERLLTDLSDRLAKVEQS